MRLLVDAQCIQSSSSLRGIGRYFLCLLHALVSSRGDHQVEVLLNTGDDADRLLRARQALESFLPARCIHTYDADWPWDRDPDAGWRRAAEISYAAAVESLSPDVLLVGSVFEGDPENVQTCSVDVPTAAVLYDLIPAADPSTYLLGPAAPEYWRRVEELVQCDHLLAISDHSADQARSILGHRAPATTTVWGGPFPAGRFPTFEEHWDERPALALPSSPLLTVGGDHPRKNLDLLVRAWGRVQPALRRAHPLVVACALSPGTVRRLERVARRAGLRHGDLVLTGRVSDDRLASLYATAHGFVFPSSEEGLGMPPLEAMARGCPTVMAAASSLLELTDEPEALVAPDDVEAWAAALTRLAVDAPYRDRLRSAARRSAMSFTWAAAAERAWGALSALTAPTTAASLPQPDLVRLSAVPPRAREAVAAAPVVVAPAEVQHGLLAAAVLDVPLVEDEREVLTSAGHDPLLRAAPRLRTAGLGPVQQEGFVAAAVRPARWTLQRSALAWVVIPGAVLDEEVLASLRTRAAARGAAVVVVGPDRAGLAEHADAVAVAAGAVDLFLLERAYARGAGIVVAGGEAPTWCTAVPGDVDSDEVLQCLYGFGKRTGHPWSG